MVGHGEGAMLVQDGDHAGALVMDIKTQERLYHITYYELHVMFILLCILFCLDATVAL